MTEPPPRDSKASRGIERPPSGWRRLAVFPPDMFGRLPSRASRGYVLAFLCGSVVIASSAIAQPPALPPAPQDAEEDGELRRRLDAQAEELRRLREELDVLRGELRERAPASSESSDAESVDEDMELSRILAESNPADDVPEWQPTFRVYGFSDMGLQRSWGTPLVTGHTSTNRLSFVLGNINFYFDAEPFRNWRTLTEVRFTLLPHGAENIYRADLGQPAEPVSTTVRDVTSPIGGFNEVQWGSIVLERSHIDWHLKDWLNIRFGYFLTPYGIWNVDHGSPTLISTTFPGFIGFRILPERQLGIEVFGSIPSGPWTYQYHFYVSNGRTPFQVDFTDNKAIGGRLVAKTTRPSRITLGMSGYMGTYDDIRKVVTYNAGTESFGFDLREQVSYREEAIAGDVSLDFGRLRIRSEVAARKVRYREGLREFWYRQGPAADRVEIGSYVLLAYMMPFLGMEPFLFLDFMKYPTILGEGMILPSGGMNFHLSPVTVLKFQYTYIIFADFKSDLPPRPQEERMHLVVSRIAIAF